ncbi:MAG: hypothetical protein KF861_09185 [Planctomycetaceae bacterium]|nr:hypothetical protein [Planctomycetaceae bacterium]
MSVSLFIWPVQALKVRVVLRGLAMIGLSFLMPVSLSATGPADAGSVQNNTREGGAAADVDRVEGGSEHMPAPGTDPMSAERRQNLAFVLMLLLTGVCLLGATLIIGTVMWGAKLRRAARSPQSTSTQLDELWYLRTPPASTSPMGEQAGQQTRVRGPDEESASSSRNEDEPT